MRTLYQLTEVRRYLTGWMQRQGGDSFRLLWFPKMGHGEMNFGPVGPETHNLQSKCIALLPCKMHQNASLRSGVDTHTRLEVGCMQANCGRDDVAGSTASSGTVRVGQRCVSRACHSQKTSISSMDRIDLSNPVCIGSALFQDRHPMSAVPLQLFKD